MDGCFRGAYKQRHQSFNLHFLHAIGEGKDLQETNEQLPLYGQGICFPRIQKNRKEHMGKEGKGCNLHGAAIKTAKGTKDTREMGGKLG